MTRGVWCGVCHGYFLTYWLSYLISPKQDPGFSHFTDYIKNMNPSTHVLTVFGLLAFSATVNFCSIVNHYAFGLEYNESIENHSPRGCIRVIKKKKKALPSGRPGRIVHEVLSGGYCRCKISQFWALYYTGPFLGPLAKTAPSRKAVLFNRQILAEAEPELIWTDQT